MHFSDARGVIRWMHESHQLDGERRLCDVQFSMYNQQDVIELKHIKKKNKKTKATK